MPTFEHGHARVHYEESGSGEAVLLLPGWAGSIEELVPLRTALAPSFRVIAADLPGSGKSGPQPRTYAPGYFAEDTEVFFAMLEALGATPARLVGFSDGGEYALLMAAVRPELVHSVVTWGAAGDLGTNVEMAAAMSSIIDDPLPPMAGFAEYLKAVYGESNARIMTQSLGSTLTTMMEAGGDISRSRAGDIACPVLLITGEQDFLATPPLVSDMAGAIANAEYVEAKGASHAVHHEQPEWLTETVVNWLTKA
jgi:valacyclovir hydrolase